MSFINWIALPRKIDKRCIRSMKDQSKFIKAKDFKGTEYEKDYCNLPDEVLVYTGDISDLYYLSISNEEEDTDTFKGVFSNNFIYEFGGQFAMNTAENLVALLDEAGLTKEELYYYASLGRVDFLGMPKAESERLQRQREETKKKVEHSPGIWVSARCRIQLYDLIKTNTNPGESVELYSCWDNGEKDVFGPPEEFRIFKVEDVLYSNAFELYGELKVEIHNTEKKENSKSFSFYP